MAKKKELDATDRKMVRQGYKDGLTIYRLATMFRVPEDTIRSAVSGIKLPTIKNASAKS